MMSLSLNWTSQRDRVSLLVKFGLNKNKNGKSFRDFDFIYIYIYIQRERERERERDKVQNCYKKVNKVKH